MAKGHEASGTKVQQYFLRKPFYGVAFTLCVVCVLPWRRKWQPTPVFLPGDLQGQGSLVGCRHGVAQRRAQLCSSSSSSSAFFFFFSLSEDGLYTMIQISMSKTKSLVEKNLHWKHLLGNNASFNLLISKTILHVQVGIEGGEFGLIQGAFFLSFLHC